jgi:rare lipoprotein A
MDLHTKKHKHQSLITLVMLIMAACLIGSLTACSVKDGPPKQDIDVSRIPNPTVRKLPRSKYGNHPYTSINGMHYTVLNSCEGYDATGIASWYGTKFHGHLTSSREKYSMLGMTAAHRTLPLPCFVQVTNLANGRTVIVKVNDRGPFANNRIIDLSYAAAKKLRLTDSGTGMVRVTSALSADHQRVLESPLKDAFYLQLAAFRLKENALKFKNKISTMTNYPIIIEKALSDGNALYKVQIGPVANNIQDETNLKRLIP